MAEHRAKMMELAKARGINLAEPRQSMRAPRQEAPAAK
jgi:hypothetical protein